MSIGPKFCSICAAGGLDVAELGDVGGHLHGLPAVPLDFLLHRGERRGIPPMYDHFCALPGELLGDGRADPA